MIDSTVVPPPERLVSPPADADAPTAASPRRWLVLGILCLSVLVITLDGTIVNVALPSLVRELGATTSPSCSGSSTPTPSSSPVSCSPPAASATASVARGRC